MRVLLLPCHLHSDFVQMKIQFEMEIILFLHLFLHCCCCLFVCYSLPVTGFCFWPMFFTLDFPALCVCVLHLKIVSIWRLSECASWTDFKKSDGNMIASWCTQWENYIILKIIFWLISWFLWKMLSLFSAKLVN